uniref:Transmembrane protein 218 n=1 Tax=Cacopsylla melanoneura TaxID=428564 RepID=A0A8D8YFY5_9HEMI
MINLTLAAGTGSLIILAIWVTTFILCCVSLRTRHNLTPFAFIVAVLVTTVLLLIPRGEIKTAPSEGIIYDNIFIRRSFILFFLFISCLTSFLYLIKSYWMEPKLAFSIKTWYLM